MTSPACSADFVDLCVWLCGRLSRRAGPLSGFALHYFLLQDSAAAERSLETRVH